MAVRDRAHAYLLRNGDCMLRSEFHDRYEQMPDGYRAELLGGIVFEPPSPVSWEHGEHHAHLNYILKTYSMNTPNVGVGDNATLILSEEDEVQPDLMLRISQEAGGKSHLAKKGKKGKKRYVEGAPELVAEVAHSSRAIDLHFKKYRYKLAGVAEYIVVCLEPKRLYWFDLASDKELAAGKTVTRSAVFPGLWISGKGLLQLDDQLTIKTLQRGLESKNHNAFAKKLAGED